MVYRSNMRYSLMLIPTLKEAPSAAGAAAPALLYRGGYVRQVAAGIFTLLPLGMRVVHKIQRIIRQEMNRTGAMEMLLPMVQPPEEIVVALLRDEVRSYRKLPLSVYQIRTQFRDEDRAGPLRGREFILQDAYSFHADEADARREYRGMCDAYSRIFRRCGLDFRLVEADPGGSATAHEFQVVAEGGEDRLVACERCDYTAGAQRALSAGGGLRSAAAGDLCGKCQQGHYREHSGIEVGYVFHLGTRYTGPMACHFLDQDGKTRPMVMGRYGIGVTRVALAAVDQHHDAEGICWPMALAPFHVTVMAATQGAADAEAARRVYDELLVRGVEVLLDDRDERPEVKVKDADLIGIPVRITVAQTGAVGVRRRDGRLETGSQKDDVAAYVTNMVQRELETSLA